MEILPELLNMMNWNTDAVGKNFIVNYLRSTLTEEWENTSELPPGKVKFPLNKSYIITMTTVKATEQSWQHPSVEISSGHLHADFCHGKYEGHFL